ncbi:hypothetical protein Hanom_Chr15g01406931 [Helianthus anomalus]
MIENNPKKKAYLVNQDDEKVAEGFSWDKYVPPDSALAAKIKEKGQEDILSETLPKEDRVDTAHARKISKSKHYPFIAEIK